MGDNPPDEELAFTPPTEERVQRRAWALSCVVCRAFLESFENHGEAATLQSRIISWIDTISLRSEFEPAELAMIEADFRTLDERTKTNGSWRSEALTVLAWALGKSNMLSHDSMVDPAAAANSLFFLAEDALEHRDELKLRAFTDLERFSAIQLAIHWRLRQFSLQPGKMNFREFVATAWFGPLSIQGVELAEDDLSIDGVTISEAPTDRVRTCQSIASERHQAINWLLGWHERYSEVDTST